MYSIEATLYPLIHWCNAGLINKRRDVSCEVFTPRITPQTKRSTVSIYKLKMYLLLLFRLYFIQTVEQAASKTTKKTKPEWK